MDEIEKIEVEDNDNYKQNETFNNNEKNNEQIMKEKIDFVLNDLDDINYKKDKRNRRKNIFFVIGIILEVFIIVFILLNVYKKDNNYKEYTCSSVELTTDYSIKNSNKYYVDKDNKVVKTVDSFVYIFNTEEKYNEFKTNYVDSNIKNFKGIKQGSVFDDDKLAFKTETTYDYNKLKKNKKVQVNGNEMVINVPNKDTITIYLEDYKTMKNLNESMGFVCE